MQCSVCLPWGWMLPAVGGEKGEGCSWTDVLGWPWLTPGAHQAPVTPLLSSKWCPSPSQEAGLSMQSHCPRGELLAPIPSSSCCREAPGQFTPQAALGWLLQRVWNCCRCSWFCRAEPELSLRQSFSASMLPTRSRTHWDVSLGMNYKVFPLWESSLQSLSAILMTPAGAVHFGCCREVTSLGNLWVCACVLWFMANFIYTNNTGA